MLKPFGKQQIFLANRFCKGLVFGIFLFLPMNFALANGQTTPPTETSTDPNGSVSNQINSIESTSTVTTKVVKKNEAAIKEVQKEIGSDGAALISVETNAAKIVDFCKRKENQNNERCIDTATTALAAKEAKELELKRAMAPAGDKTELLRTINERDAQITSEIAHRRQLTELFAGRLKEYAKEAEGNPLEQAEVMRAGDVSMRQYTYSNASKLTKGALDKEREENERLKAELALLGSPGTVNQANAQSLQSAAFLQSAQRITIIAGAIAETAKTIDRMGDAQENMLDRLRNEQATINLLKQTGIYSETAGGKSANLNLRIPAEQAQALGFADVKEKTQPDGTYIIQGEISAARGAGTRTIAEYEQQLPKMISAQKESLAYLEMQRNNMTELANLYNARAVVLEARGGNAKAAAQVMSSAPPARTNSDDYSNLAGIAGLVGMASQMRGKSGGTVASAGQSNSGGRVIFPETISTTAKNPVKNEGGSTTKDSDTKKESTLASGASSAVQVVKGALAANKANSNLGKVNISGNGLNGGANGKSLGAGALDSMRDNLFGKKVSARIDPTNNALGDTSGASRSPGSSRGPAIAGEDDSLGGLVQSLLGGVTGNNSDKNNSASLQSGELDRGLASSSPDNEKENLDIPLFARVKEKLTQLEQKGEISSSQKGNL